MKANRSFFLPALALALFSSAVGHAQDAEKLPPGRTLVRVEALPAAIDLKTPIDYRQVLLTGVLDSGETVDVTRLAKLEQAVPAVKVSPRGLVRPAADGVGVLTFAVAGQKVNIPVTVTGQKQEYPVSFTQDVMPVLAKMGCNQGTCHGSAKGKNGFQLSLRGYDPVYDHRALTDDVMGRRFDRSAPDRSLMVLKPVGEVPHVGGVLMQVGDPYYNILLSWIADGVKLDAASPRVASITVTPGEATIALPGMAQQMVVVATYADGRQRDVTAEAFLESSNTEVAKVDKEGLVTAIRRGETAILARYEGKYAASPLVVMGDRSGFAWQPVEGYNFIDDLVYEKLKKVKVLPSDVCTDAEFIRRVYLDLTGLPPTPEDVTQFLADTAPSRQKRAALVDRLIGSPAFVEHWTSKWADLLQVNAKFLGPQGAKAYRDWIEKAVAANLPYDQFAYRVLTASGSNMENPAAAYWKILRKPDEAMENTTHLFLGVRFNCNKCHDHPFEKWTQSQYYDMAAFFAQVGRQEDPKYKGQKIGGTAVMGAQPLVEVVLDTKSGEVKNERTGQNAVPQFPFTHGDMPPEGGPRREQLAKWITSPENPYFARSMANRLWSYLLGVGLIEPVDDIRAGNPPTNPELLEKLTEEFVRSGFDVRHLMRLICTSRTYQHSIQTNRWNEDDGVNYSHALARRLPAEVLYDAIHRATGSVARLPGLPAGARAAELVDPDAQIPGGFLKLLGQPPRESACECERSNSMMLGPVLNLINGPVMANAITDPDNRIHKLLAAEKDDAKVVAGLFLAILNRPATAQEIDLGVRQLRGYRDEHQQMLARRDQLVKELRDHEQKLDAAQAAWEEQQRQTARWVALDVTDVTSTNKATKFEKQADGSVLTTGAPAKNEDYTVTATTDLEGITAVRLEVLPDDRLPGKGPGRADNGNFVLNEFKLTVQPVEGDAKNGEKEAKPTAVFFQKALADFQQQGFQVQKAIDGNLNPNSGWAISDKLGVPHTAAFEVRGKTGFPKGTKLTFLLQHRFADGKHNVGRFRLSVTTAAQPVQLQLLPENVARLLEIPAEQRKPKQAEALRNYYRSKDEALPRLQQAVNAYRVPEDPRAIGAQDLAWALLNSRGFLFNH